MSEVYFLSSILALAVAVVFVTMFASAGIQSHSQQTVPIQQAFNMPCELATRNRMS